MKRIWGDRGYSGSRGEWVKESGDCVLEIICRPPDGAGLVVLPRRGVVERNTNSDNKSLINICRVIVGGASLPRLFPLNAQKAENEIALCVSDRNATFLFRNGISLRG